MRHPPSSRFRSLGLGAGRRGFTMVELMITLTVLATVMVVLTTVVYTAARSRTATANRIESSQAARVAVDMLARDLRSSGYGADLDYAPLPQPPIAYIDSQQVLINANLQPYPDDETARAAPLAYEPMGVPKPHPLIGTAWTPPIRYNTGAELIRWTLDVNNDGAVDALDIAAAAGVDARRTPNPDDYVLVRQVYGDSSFNIKGFNGGLPERIALIRKPGGTVPPIFTVYMKGYSTPWNWASGPVPANQLHDIERIEINVVAPSGKPDWRGRYAETPIRTEVYSIRNVPNFGEKEFPVDGYVFNDLNRNGTQEPGEPGLAGVSVSLGTLLSTITNGSGYFLFSAAGGTYTLKHKPPANYRTLTNPDSFIVTIGPGVTRSFADTIIPGGWVTARVWEDNDKQNNIKEAKEPWREDETVTLDGFSDYTDEYGTVKFFSEIGSFTLTLTVPDSFTCTTTNPVTGTMNNGDSLVYDFALIRQSPGKLKGLVWQDKNGNGVVDGGEKGVGNVWVGATRVDGSVVTYEYSESDGKFEIEVPANNPPSTDPYTLECIPPSGYYPTTALEIGSIYVSVGQTLTGYNFGVNSFQQITLNSSRVLSLASGDFIEKDWGGNKPQDARGDADLLLGADASGSDQISVWFNQYNKNPLFKADRNYSRSAPHSVMCIAADSLSEDPYPFSGSLDAVTGTKLAGAGNFFVWYAQATSGNEGYFAATYDRAYRTQDNGDVQAVQTRDLVGNKGIDILVGTKSPTAGQGTIEIWKSNGADRPDFTRDEIYPPKGSIPGNDLGEVTAMQLSDLRSKGKSAKWDLVVGTRKSDYSGQLLFFGGDGGGGSVFKLDDLKTLSTGAVTSLTCADYNADSLVDVVVGVQTGFNKGALQFWRNTSSKCGGCGAPLQFTLDTTLVAPGIPISLASGDMGGQANPDIVMGYRTDGTGYGGGVLIYYMENGKVPTAPLDPSGGSVTHMVPALNVNNFNFGVNPSMPPPPYQLDVAAGVKSGPSTGALVVFIR